MTLFPGVLHWISVEDAWVEDFWDAIGVPVPTPTREEVARRITKLVSTDIIEA